MVARGPALPPLSLAAFLRSLLPAQPAPCPHGAGARAAFRKPGCISPVETAPRGHSAGPGPLGPHPAVPSRLPSLRLRRWLRGPAQPRATR